VRSWLTANLPLKLLSLAVAAGIWLWVTGEEKLEFSFPAPLILQSLPESMALATPAPDQVMVRLRAPEELLKRLAAGDIDARLDLTGLGAGGHQIPVSPDRVRVPFGAEVIKVSPEMVWLVVEPRVSREVPVEPRVEGQLPPGFVLGKVEVRPARVAVEGPEGAVGGLRSASTERVPLDGHREPFAARVNALVGNPLLRVLADDPVTVSVQVVPARDYNGRGGRN